MADIQDLLEEFHKAISEEEVIEEKRELPELTKNYLKAVSFEIGHKVLKLDGTFDETIWDYLITLIRPEICRQLIKPYFLTLNERKCEKSELIKSLKELHSNFNENYIVACGKIKDYCVGMSEWTPTYQNDITSSRIKEIQDLFELNDLEAKIITVFYMKESIPSITSLLTHERNISDLDKSLDFYRSFLETNEATVRELFHYKNSLRKLSLLENPEQGRVVTNNFKLNTNIPILLSSMDKTPLSEKLFSRLELKETFSIESFKLGAIEEKLLLNLLSINKGAAIHIKGDSHTGKTELARSLARELNKDIFIINTINPERKNGDQNLSFQRLALCAAAKSLDPKKSILFFDEADEFVCSDREEKWLEEFLPSSPILQIWATESINHEPLIFKERFNMSLKLENSKEKLKYALEIKSKELGLTDEVIAAIGSNIAKVSPALLNNVIQDVKLMLDSGKINSSEIGTAVKALLGSEKTATASNSQLNPMVDNYLSTLINTSVRPQHLINVLKDFRAKLMSDQLPPDVRNYNLLFYGVPGTGKTEFAKYISQHVGAPFIIRRSSDINSKWVGESEKNIRDLFNQAQEENAVLFLDECDTMFPPRENAQRSYETSRTNEMLVAMENFKGILICCTNFKETLDSAAIRRFAQKVKFDFLLSENVPVFFEKFFDLTLSPQQKNKLASISNLAPGDFNIVRKRMLMEEIKETSELIKILEEEVNHKQGKHKRMGL